MILNRYSVKAYKDLTRNKKRATVPYARPVPPVQFVPPPQQPENSLSSKQIINLYNSYQSTFTPKYLSTNMNSLLSVNNLQVGPSNVFIIRHAEKNHNEPSQKKYYYNINDDGINRASQLPDYINKLGEKGYPIYSIITCLPIDDSGHIAMRPQSTIMLSSFLLNIPLFMIGRYDVSQSYNYEMVLELFTNPIFTGKNILIVWEHVNTQALTNQIVQCSNYLSQHSVTDLLNNKSAVFESSTEDWWRNNTPISNFSQHEYNNTNNTPPLSNIPYLNYSKYLPYWNTNNFDSVYHFSRNNDILKFVIENENIFTGYKNCELIIGYLQCQTLWYGYLGESYCEPPH
jgi:hypothetical protein